MSIERCEKCDGKGSDGFGQDCEACGGYGLVGCMSCASLRAALAQAQEQRDAYLGTLQTVASGCWPRPRGRSACGGTGLSPGQDGKGQP